MRLHRILQRGMERGVDVADHGVRELVVHLGMLVNAPLRFQAAIHHEVIFSEEKNTREYA